VSGALDSASTRVSFDIATWASASGYINTANTSTTSTQRTGCRRLPVRR
jgi:hypothetical protein